MSEPAKASEKRAIVACARCGKRNRLPAGARGTPRCAACKDPLPWLVDADDGSLESELQTSRPVLVDLWAQWCGPCKAMAPALEELARTRREELKVVRVDVDRAPAAAARFEVSGIPLLVLLQDGKELGRQVGAMPAAALGAWLDGQLARGAAAGGG